MKIVLKIKVFSKENPEGLIYTKAYYSDVAPRIGEKVKDSLFAKNKEVIDVIYDLLAKECYVILESKELPHERFNNGHIQEVADMHNWVQISKIEDIV